MLQGGLIKFDKTVFLQKNCYRMCIVYGLIIYARNALPKINMDCR